jgi:hypothetical protein
VGRFIAVAQQHGGRSWSNLGGRPLRKVVPGLDELFLPAQLYHPVTRRVDHHPSYASSVKSCSAPAQSLQVEQSIETSEAPRCLTAANLAVAVGDGEQPIANYAPLVNADLLKSLA